MSNRYLVGTGVVENPSRRTEGGPSVRALNKTPTVPDDLVGEPLVYVQGYNPKDHRDHLNVTDFLTPRPPIPGGFQFIKWREYVVGY